MKSVVKFFNIRDMDKDKLNLESRKSFKWLKWTLIIICLIITIVLLYVWYSGQFPLLVSFVKLQVYNPGAVEKYKQNNIALSKRNSLIDSSKKVDRIQCPCYYINLDRSQDRMLYMENEFKTYNIKTHLRISAVDGKKLTLSGGLMSGEIVSNQYQYNFINKDQSLSASEVGCTFSHLISIITAYKNGLKRVFISEDDVCFALMPSWSLTIPEICSGAPEDWELLHLFQFTNTDNVMEPYQPYNNTLGAVSYLVNEKGIKSVVDKCYNQVTNTITIDPTQVGAPNGLADVFLFKLCKTYSYTVPLFFTYNETDVMTSTIHIDHTLDHLVRMNEIIGYYTEPAFYITQSHVGEKYTNFLSKLLPHMKQNTNNSDDKNAKCVIVYTASSSKHTYILTQPELNNRPNQFKIVFDVESRDISHLEGINLLFTSKTDKSLLPENTPTVYIPAWFLGLTEAKVNISDLMTHPFQLERLETTNKKFCALIYFSNDKGHGQGRDYRTQFLDELQSRSGNRVDILNGLAQKPKYIYNQYKFILAIEDSFLPSYITKKLIDPLLSIQNEASATIPIYCGAPNVDEYFNTGRFIHVRDFESISECIDRIFQIEKSPQMFQKIINEPIFHENKLDKRFQWSSILQETEPHLPHFLQSSFVEFQN